GRKPKSTNFPAAGDEQNQGRASAAFASLARASGEGLGDQEIPSHVPDSHGVVGIQGNAQFPFLAFDPGLGQVGASQSILRAHGSSPPSRTSIAKANPKLLVGQVCFSP